MFRSIPRFPLLHFSLSLSFDPAQSFMLDVLLNTFPLSLLHFFSFFFLCQTPCQEWCVEAVLSSSHFRHGWVIEGPRLISIWLPCSSVTVDRSVTVVLAQRCSYRLFQTGFCSRSLRWGRVEEEISFSWHPEQNRAGLNSSTIFHLSNSNGCTATDDSWEGIKTLNVYFTFPSLCSIWEDMQICRGS